MGKQQRNRSHHSAVAGRAAGGRLRRHDDRPRHSGPPAPADEPAPCGWPHTCPAQLGAGDLPAMPDQPQPQRIEKLSDR